MAEGLQIEPKERIINSYLYRGVGHVGLKEIIEAGKIIPGPEGVIFATPDLKYAFGFTYQEGGLIVLHGRVISDVQHEDLKAALRWSSGIKIHESIPASYIAGMVVSPDTREHLLSYYGKYHRFGGRLGGWWGGKKLRDILIPVEWESDKERQVKITMSTLSSLGFKNMTLFNST